ncbi:MAG: hypothetical protein AVDCRST_MAG72-2606 [uncultured Nocardioidaceae bacterium]|uniref:BD-FAE-like domain-containing protein n=1 Tax=uncultured Nocardioidaceae bacterium TaxID=253824 RepID=A0A6J4MRS9_9ACTN|nr:MAG: hypothetical protein AVDCRST_MAG72-2606 [uncultured Nocardioidaceae bacterium]
MLVSVTRRRGLTALHVTRVRRSRVPARHRTLREQKPALYDDATGGDRFEGENSMQVRLKSSQAGRVAGWLAAALSVAGLVLGGVQGPAVAASDRYLDPIFSSVRVDKDLVYGRVDHGGGDVERLKLDLYRPSGDTKSNRPVLIFVHGGDSSVDKGFKRNRMVPKGFAHRGFVAAAINYRDGTNGTSRASQHDTRAAVRWFRANADRYRVSPSRIVVMGSSAGGVNVLHVAFNPDDAGSSGHPGFSSKVAAAISVAGADAEPQHIGTGEPPIAMVHAADDTTVPIAAARATCEQTKASGNVCTFFEYAEGGHPPEFLTENLARITEQSSRFICRQVLDRVSCRG